MNKETGLYWLLCLWDILGILKRVFVSGRFSVLCTAQPHQTPIWVRLHTWTMHVAYVTAIFSCEILLSQKWVFPRFQDLLCTSRQPYKGRPWADCGGHQYPQQVSLLCGIPQCTAPDLLQEAHSCWSGMLFWCFGLWLPLILNWRSCDLPRVAPRSSLITTMQTCRPANVPCWTLRWPCVAATLSRISISRLWRNTALTVKTPGTSPPLLLSSPCPIGLLTSQTWDQMRTSITWAVYRGTRAKMVEQWRVTSFLMLLMWADLSLLWLTEI